MTQAKISILPHPEFPQLLVVKPSSFLGKSFGSYIDVVRANGGEFQKDAKHHLVTAACLLDLVTGLVCAGFKISAHKELLFYLDSYALALKSEALNEAERLEELAETKLYPFQQTGVLFLEANPRAMLIDEMGLGKTVQALMAIPWSLEPSARTIVVCPAVMKHVWARECKRWRPDLTPVVVEGRPANCLPYKGVVVIVNYEILPEITPIHVAELPLVTLIADEAHYVKNYKAQRTKRFRALAKHAKRVWLLTGTPLLNRPDELWAVLEAAGLGRRAYGSWTHFKVMFGHNMQEGRDGEWGTPKEDAFKGLQRVALRRTKREVLADLPEKTYRVHPVDLDDEMRLQCDTVMAEVQALIDAGEPVEMWSNVAELMQVRKNLALRKYGLALQLIREYEANNEPVVVFSAHKRPIELLADREGWTYITGDTSPEGRDYFVEAFQGGAFKGIALTIPAGGVGITLTRAAHMIFIDLMWTPAQNEQAEDRIHRIGQDRGCIYTHLVADHELDELMDKTLRRKQALISATVAKVGASDSVDERVAKLELMARHLRTKLERKGNPHETMDN